ncbi:MAG: redox-regulated ATPase YchF [Chloroflexi bacterium]|nr:redox-regulated ATPase YchF [Chloroflexota bacterium]
MLRYPGPPVFSTEVPRLETGIIGLPKSGKTTIFNALTHGKAETDAFATSVGPNIGMAKVPDSRLRTLTAMFKPRKTVPAEIKYVDVAAYPHGYSKGQGISGQLLTQLSNVDALLLVARCFVEDSIPHVENSIDTVRDVATFQLELAFSDLAIQERRLERLVSSMKGAKSPEKERLLAEQELLGRIKDSLEKEISIRQQRLSADDLKLISNYQFLTAKPILVVANIGEDQLPQALNIEGDLRARFGGAGCDAVAICGKLEMELSRLPDEEAVEFRRSMGGGESALEKVIKRTYSLLGLISFFTVGADEVRAWTVGRDSPAVKAAGKIHSDIERGFIRAEVISYDDLVKCGGLGEARKLGLLRLEGKTYQVKDGDVINFLFSV